MGNLCVSGNGVTMTVAIQKGELGFARPGVVVEETENEVVLQIDESSPEAEALLKQSGCVVQCSEGHYMEAELLREMNLFHAVRGATCAAVGECENCEEEIFINEARYHCKECSEMLCLNCSRQQLGIPMLNKPDNSHAILNLEPGDIVMAGPTEFGIHHVILVVSKLRLEPDIHEALMEDENSMHLELTSSDQVWSCETIESTQALAGEDTWWYATRTYFSRDPHSRVAQVIGDEAPSSTGHSTLNVAETPVPFKILLHPLRKDFGGKGINGRVFNETLAYSREASMEYGKGTAVRAYVNQRLQRYAGLADRATLYDYPTLEDREQLMDDYETSWESPPICASVVVKVWQRYFKALHGDNRDAAVMDIIRYMPCFCNTITPSQLTKVLAQSGWYIVDNLEETAEEK